MRVRRVALAAGAELAYAPNDWRDCMLVIKQGSLELESRHGPRRTFVAGDALWLAGLRLRVIRNPGRVKTVLAVMGR